MGSAISRSASYSNTLMMPLDMHVQFAQSQLAYAAAVSSQQNTLAQVNTAVATQNGNGGNTPNSPDEAALRNFTQTLIKAFAYMGIPLLIVGGIVYGVNFSMNFLGQPALFAILLLCLLGFYYFVIGINQATKANIATLKLFFLGLFICGIIAGILAFAVYTPPTEKLPKIPSIQNMEVQEVAACYTFKPQSVYDLVRSVASIDDSGKVPCLTHKDLAFSTVDLQSVFNLPIRESCSECGEFTSSVVMGQPVAEGRLRLLKKTIAEHSIGFDRLPTSSDKIVVVVHFPEAMDINQFMKLSIDLQKNRFTPFTLKANRKLVMKASAEGRGLTDEEVTRLKFVYDDVKFGGVDHEYMQYLVSSNVFIKNGSNGFLAAAQIVNRYNGFLYV